MTEDLISTTNKSNGSGDQHTQIKDRGTTACIATVGPISNENRAASGSSDGVDKTQNGVLPRQNKKQHSKVDRNGNDDNTAYAANTQCSSSNTTPASPQTQKKEKGSKGRRGDGSKKGSKKNKGNNNKVNSSKMKNPNTGDGYNTDGVSIQSISSNTVPVSPQTKKTGKGSGAHYGDCAKRVGKKKKKKDGNITDAASFQSASSNTVPVCVQTNKKGEVSASHRGDDCNGVRKESKGSNHKEKRKKGRNQSFRDGNTSDAASNVSTSLSTSPATNQRKKLNEVSVACAADDDGGGKRGNSSMKKVKHRKRNKIDKHTTVDSSSGHNNNNNKVNTKSKDTTIKKKNRRSLQKKPYPPYHSHRECLDRIAKDDPTLIRGRLRVQPGGKSAFVSCDRGRYSRDIFLDGEKARNRAMNGDVVFVEIVGSVGDDADGGSVGCGDGVVDSEGKVLEGGKRVVLGDVIDGIVDGTAFMKLSIDGVADETMSRPSDGVAHVDVSMKDVDDGNLGEDEDGQVDMDVFADNEDDQIDADIEYEDYYIPDEDEEESEDSEDSEDDEDSESEETSEGEMWQDDDIQKSLWDPIVHIRKPNLLSQPPQSSSTHDDMEKGQPLGTVVLVLHPKLCPSEINPSSERHVKARPRKTVVGSLMALPGPGNRRMMLVPANRCLPLFMTPYDTMAKFGKGENGSGSSAGSPDSKLYRGEHVYGTWSPTDKWPPCSNVQVMGSSGNVEDETQALLTEFECDEIDFPPAALQNVEATVESGRFQTASGETGWAPTPAMLEGRRDYRSERIFTIDPTSAKDLDDALHVRDLGDGRVEVGVHIADCSYFVEAGSAVDREGRRRATTVYLVDRTVPMLPRPLCEIACSLNENVDRLAFSCVWTMNMDGTLCTGGNGAATEAVWYGRSVIRSCARLDYATAQNIIDQKVATTDEQTPDPTLWPKSRQPTGKHTISAVAQDVRLLHKVAMARRALRLRNGALALNGVKLAFQLEDDGETPSLCEPYPIRDSNRLIEEYMLLANFLVAQRLITHAGGLALLRRHPPPVRAGLEKVVDVAREGAGFHIDAASSETLQVSLNRLAVECADDTLTLQCVTAMLTTPMQQARYIAAGGVNKHDWCHFALHIPYYTHFTSPIRRYADIIVHRLLQATIDGQHAVEQFVHSELEIQEISTHCNEKKELSRKAQDRSDIVFLSIYLKKNPIPSTLAVVTSVGKKTFTVFVPSLGLNTKIFLDDHREKYNVTVNEGSNGSINNMVLTSKVKAEGPSRINIKVFSKIAVSCNCKETPPIDVALRIVGTWVETT